MKFLPQKFNDALALLGLAAIFSMWVWVPLAEDIRGATIMLATMAWQFYFRRSPDAKDKPKL